MFRNMSISQRSTIGFGVLALMLVLVGSLALREMKSMRSAAEEVDNNWLPSIQSLAIINQSFLGVRLAALSAKGANSKEALQQEVQRLEEAKRLLVDAQTKYERLISSERERTLFVRYQQTVTNYLSNVAQIIVFASKGQDAEASELLSSKVRPIAFEVSKLLDELIELNRQGASDAAAVSENAYTLGFIVVVSVLIAAVILTFILAAILTRSIVQPLMEAVQVAERVAAGNLTQDFSIEGHDEPARLLDALKTMQHSLRDTLHQIHDASSQLASASEELTAVAEDTSRNLGQQNREIEQAATAVNEMAASVDEVASNALNTSEASQQSDRTASNGREQVMKTVSSINGLASDVTSTVEQIGQLASRVQDISKVLDVIRAIAEQTNLLALNAAIEAARAGDAGRGFAVVADEVRALAHRTQQSTREIEQMIGSIQGSTEQAVSAMQNSNVQAKNTLEVAQKASESLNEIASAISHINKCNLLIASASEEQAKVTREVDKNLVNIRDLSTQSSAGAHQTMAASQELSRLAVTLNGLISHFRV